MPGKTSKLLLSTKDVLAQNYFGTRGCFDAVRRHVNSDHQKTSNGGETAREARAGAAGKQGASVARQSDCQPAIHTEDRSRANKVLARGSTLTCCHLPFSCILRETNRDLECWYADKLVLVPRELG